MYSNFANKKANDSNASYGHFGSVMLKPTYVIHMTKSSNAFNESIDKVRFL